MSIGNVFAVDVQVNYNGTFYTNIWHILAADLVSAHATGMDIAQIEKTLLPEYVIINKVRTTRVGTGNFISEITDITGSRVQGAGDNAMPLFNRYLLGLQPANGYHGKKFLGVVRESDQDGGTLTPAARSYIETNVSQPLEALNSLCSPSGTPYTDVTVSPVVAMRQLRRARKRKTPVI